MRTICHSFVSKDDSCWRVPPLRAGASGSHLHFQYSMRQFCETWTLLATDAQYFVHVKPISQQTAVLKPASSVSILAQRLKES